MKKSKQAYYDKYFERNWSNIKNTWKGINSLISIPGQLNSLLATSICDHDGKLQLIALSDYYQ